MFFTYTLKSKFTQIYKQRNWYDCYFNISVVRKPTGRQNIELRQVLFSIVQKMSFYFIMSTLSDIQSI